jgi:phenylacetate-CoA ligase
MSSEDLPHPLLDRHPHAPAWPHQPAKRACAKLHPTVRVGGAHDEFHEELDVPESSIWERATGKLQSTLRWALETVPAYRAHRALLRHIDDPVDVLARLPLTGKSDIRAHPDRYLSTATPASQRLGVVTEGCTRDPTQFYLQKHVTRSKEHAFIQAFRARVGAGSDDLTLALRGRTVASATKPGGSLWMVEPIKRQLVLSTDHLEERYMPEHAAVLAQHRPPFIEAFPSALDPLARWLKLHPVPEFTDAVRGVMLYSEYACVPRMQLFREVFRCPVLKHYGHSERVLMAASMPDADRYFFWPQYGWLELLDDNDRPITRPGVMGHVVGTSFDNKVMPFVRYRTGDLALASDHGHSRLPGYPACERIERPGRARGIAASAGVSEAALRRTS